MRKIKSRFYLLLITLILFIYMQSSSAFAFSLSTSNLAILAQSNSRFFKLATVVSKILNDASHLSNEDKIIYVHDYLITNATHDSYDEEISLYDVLVKNMKSSYGYALTQQMLFDLMEIDNVLIKSQTIVGESDHWYNKVKLSEEWFNIDSFVDSSSFNEYGSIRYGYCLTDDAVLQQRYVWDTQRYPAAVSKNNFYRKKGLSVGSQLEMEALIKDFISKQEDRILFWVDDYHATRYRFSFIKNIEEVKSFKVSLVPATLSRSGSDIGVFATDILVALEYRSESEIK